MRASGGSEALLERVICRQRLVLDLDQVDGFSSRHLVACDDRSDWIADEPNALDSQGMLILADGENAVRDGEVGAGQNQSNTRKSGRSGRVDSPDSRVRQRGSQELRMQHPRQRQVVGKCRLPGDLGACVDSSPRPPDDFHGLAMAASTASKICW
jgi:hypothetical protein